MGLKVAFRHLSHPPHGILQICGRCPTSLGATGSFVGLSANGRYRFEVADIPRVYGPSPEVIPRESPESARS